MSDGTSLDDIETGNISNEADSEIMNAIMSEMNAGGESTPVYSAPPQIYSADMPPIQPMPPMQQPMPQMQQQMPPMYQYQQQQHQQPVFSAQYEQDDAEEGFESSSASATSSAAAAAKKNSWSAAFDRMRDPMIVGLLVCFFSLPALHTWISKRAAWAYKVGGSLSWTGFLVQFLIVAGIFALYQYGVQILGV